MIIEPQGAGTATETRHIFSDQYFEGYWVECAATPNKGYRFSHFEWISHVQQDDYPVYTSQGRTTSNPTTERNSPQFSDTHGLDISLKTWYEGLKAVFEKEEKLFTVTTGIFPETAKGTSNGDGTYESGTVVTIDVHQKCNLWIFDHWQFSTGETYSSKSVSFTVSRTVTCTAFFRHENTGELIFDADGSGDLIMGDGGSLLYNGDLVTA